MTAPELSVVVPSVNGMGDLTECLDALAVQCRDCSLEVLVMDRCGGPLRDAVRQRYPWVRVFAMEPNCSIPAMRARAFAEAAGEYVAVIEDHVIVLPGWARQMLAAAREAETVVGGCVENAATDTVVDWAAFLCEYSHCLQPLPAGRVDWLTGNNVIYPRELLVRYAGVIAREGWENQLHDALRADGVPLECRPEICVEHKKHYTVGEYVSQRYFYARSYAAMRVASATLARRLAFGIAAFALPPLLLYRMVSRIMAKGRYGAELVRSLPLLALFVTSWALGELVGYWAGPGDALAKVR